MNLKLVVIPASEEQFNKLVPLTDHQQMRDMVDEFEKQPTTEKNIIYCGYFILNDVFNIVLVPEAKHFGDALTKAMNRIVLPEINKYYSAGPKQNAVDNAEGEKQ